MLQQVVVIVSDPKELLALVPHIRDAQRVDGINRALPARVLAAACSVWLAEERELGAIVVLGIRRRQLDALVRQRLVQTRYLASSAVMPLEVVCQDES